MAHTLRLAPGKPGNIHHATKLGAQALRPSPEFCGFSHQRRQTRQHPHQRAANPRTTGDQVNSIRFASDGVAE
jgi:hypothetical protein